MKDIEYNHMWGVVLDWNGNKHSNTAKCERLRGWFMAYSEQPLIT